MDLSPKSGKSVIKSKFQVKPPNIATVFQSRNDHPKLDKSVNKLELSPRQ